MMASFADVVCNHSSPAIQCRHGVTWFTHEDEDYANMRHKALCDAENYKESKSHTLTSPASDHFRKQSGSGIEGAKAC